MEPGDVMTFRCPTPCTEGEQWAPVPGFEGLYEASSAGRIRSLHGGGRRIRRLYRDPKGYLTVQLHRNGSRRTWAVHRLVLAAFGGPIGPGQEARHLDGNPANNTIGNLAYGTHSENAMDQIRHGTHHRARVESCPKGHPYDEANTYVRRGGHRACRACHREHERERYARLRRTA